MRHELFWIQYDTEKKFVITRTQCATQFIHLLSSEASEICEKVHNKRTISPEHAFTALENLGFGSMVKDGNTALNDYRSAVAKKRRKSHRLENLGIPVRKHDFITVVNE